MSQLRLWHKKRLEDERKAKRAILDQSGEATEPA